ncbi:uncharacterized protein LOC111267995 isoform X2 [Varroa jacobsoni]|uniref:uncharacterized protein LOC111267995 isoform X2 n=1 Tax=Varroa jacobsoni TaxID=62625 RepID=UPI000BF825FB|nr:uncharacterized protein LOC111267995 isoform X2 [Varroa jacobsoni]
MRAVLSFCCLVNDRSVHGFRTLWEKTVHRMIVVLSILRCPASHVSVAFIWCSSAFNLVTMTVIRDFSIGSVTFEGMQSSNQLTVLGRSMVPPELLERLDDEVQVKIVDIRGSAIYAHLAHLPMEHAGETHEILCAVTHRFTRDFPAIIAAKDWELMVKETVSPRREIIMV